MYGLFGSWVAPPPQKRVKKTHNRIKQEWKLENGGKEGVESELTKSEDEWKPCTQETNFKTQL